MAVALILLACALLGMSWRLGRGPQHTEEYFLAGRRLPGSLAGLSQASNALPLWLLLAVAGAAFMWGFAAVWILIAALMGHAVCWHFVAPRLQVWATDRRAVSLLKLLSADAGAQMRGPVILSMVAILIIAMLTGMAAYLSLLGQAMAGLLPVSARTGMFLAIACATLAALFGGYRGTCVADAIGAVGSLAFLFGVAILALIAAGGWPAVWQNLADLPADVGLWTGEGAGVLAVTFILGTLILGLMPLGQPQVMSRFIACTDPRELKAGSRIALVWLIVGVGSTLVCGWSARLLLPGELTGDAIIPGLFAQLLPAALVTVVLAGLLMIAVVTLNSLLLALASAISMDVRRDSRRRSLVWPKPAVVLVGALSAVVALEISEPSFERLLLAWTLLGSSFGPLVLVRLAGKRVRPGSTLGSIWAGFVLTLLLHLLPSAPGDFLERALPFVVALGIALSGGERRADPDRADRAQQLPTSATGSW